MKGGASWGCVKSGFVLKIFQISNTKPLFTQPQPATRKLATV